MGFAVRALAGALIVAAIGTIGSASEPSRALPMDTWRMYQFAPDHNAVFDSPDWDVSWTLDLSKGCAAPGSACFSTYTYVPAEINGGLSIVGTTIYVESYDQKVHAIDARSGSELWAAPMANIAMNAPLVANGIVIAGSGGASAYRPIAGGKLVFGRPQGDGIYAFDAHSGALVWRYDTAGSNMPTGALTDDATPAFVFTNGDFQVHALHVSGGTPRWIVPIQGAGVMSSLAERDGVIYGSTGYGLASAVIQKAFAKRDAESLAHHGWTWAMRESDGALLWSSPYGRGFGSPVVADGVVFEESTVSRSWTDAKIWSSEIVALDATSGALLWRYVGKAGVAGSRATNDDAIGGTYDDGILYQTLPYGSTFAAFDGRSGRVLWQIPTTAPVKMSPVVAGGLVYFGDTSGVFYVLRAGDGAVERTYTFPSIFTTTPPVIVGHTIFVANGSTLYALRLRDVQSGNLAPLNILELEGEKRRSVSDK